MPAVMKSRHVPGPGSFVSALIVMVVVASRSYCAHNTTAAHWEKSIPAGQANEPNIEILVAGASRTGTSSMQAALQHLGYHTTHWQGYMIRYFDFIYHSYQKSISEPDLHKVFQDIPSKGALLDTVVPWLFDDLRRAYPRAKVILTTREPSAWLKSYEKYVAKSCEFIFPNLFEVTDTLFFSKISHFWDKIRVPRSFFPS